MPSANVRNWAELCRVRLTRFLLGRIYRSRHVTVNATGPAAAGRDPDKSASAAAELMRSVKGFVGYTLARSGDGGFSVTVCQDKTGIDESVQKAKDWIAKNAGSTGVGAPEISEGPVLIHLK
ncbi:hypothetical protein [Paraburkholderia sp. GAS32]|uniref:hypothetical protein n=1 Tax=Paraburkholderia sp. GAS32 TaxID=3035129 RepID=UPI003D1ED470